jgi:hypothetical protein
MAKKLIKLTESDLHRIIKESVNKVLKEGYFDDENYQDFLEFCDRYEHDEDDEDDDHYEYNKYDFGEDDGDNEDERKNTAVQYILSGKLDDFIIDNELKVSSDMISLDYGLKYNDTTILNALKKRIKTIKTLINRITRGEYDWDIIDEWEEFYNTLTCNQVKNAAKKRKNFLDLMDDKNLSKEWRRYYYDRDFWNFDNVKDINESTIKWHTKTDDEAKELDTYLNLIFSSNYKVPRIVKETIIKIMNAKTIGELHHIQKYAYRIKHYRKLIRALIERQSIILDPEEALYYLKSPSADFNSETYNGPKITLVNTDEKNDEMWGENNKRIRRLDKFIRGNNMTWPKVERAIKDNIIKHEFGGRNPETEKLHTKGSANRDLIAMDKNKK